jgi:hypothetical protein
MADYDYEPEKPTPQTDGVDATKGTSSKKESDDYDYEDYAGEEKKSGGRKLKTVLGGVRSRKLRALAALAA